MEIIEVNQVTDELIESIAKLLPQLTKKPIPSRETITDIVACPTTILLSASENGSIIGMLTLVLYRTPSALRSRIEDVVVDEQSRGKGIGQALVRYAINIARDKKAFNVDLTSEPNRKSAHKLYENIGFKKHETNVYRYILG
ncbi:MAG TPA: GNAT family N-acetyltransferase [Phycisphaerales bacterium]|nr:GNAT family N-acetyltransferase [Phycisphaerales bacterium]